MTQAAPVAAAGANATSELVLLGRVTLSLLVVLVLAVLAGRLARRARIGAATGALRVHSRVGLTRESSVALVEVGEQVLVLGVTPASVTLLTTLTTGVLQTDPLVAEAPARPTGRTGPARAWPQLLEALREKTVRRTS